jgi:hypothetical protein
VNADRCRVRVVRAPRRAIQYTVRPLARPISGLVPDNLYAFQLRFFGRCTPYRRGAAGWMQRRALDRRHDVLLVEERGKRYVSFSSR